MNASVPPQKTRYFRHEREEAKAFLRDARTMMSHTDHFVRNTRHRKPDGSIWLEVEAMPPGKEYSLTMIKPAPPAVSDR